MWPVCEKGLGATNGLNIWVGACTCAVVFCISVLFVALRRLWNGFGVGANKGIGGGACWKKRGVVAKFIFGVVNGWLDSKVVAWAVGMFGS